jgi:hypothetical protein
MFFAVVVVVASYICIIASMRTTYSNSDRDTTGLTFPPGNQNPLRDSLATIIHHRSFHPSTDHELQPTTPRFHCSVSFGFSLHLGLVPHYAVQVHENRGSESIQTVVLSVTTFFSTNEQEHQDDSPNDDILFYTPVWQQAGTK